jgi:hypothetical protein
MYSYISCPTPNASKHTVCKSLTHSVCLKYIQPYPKHSTCTLNLHGNSLAGLTLILSFYHCFQGLNTYPCLNIHSSSPRDPAIMCIHCNENPIYVFLVWELRGLSPNFHIHVSVSDLYIPRIGPQIFLQQNRQTDPDCRNWNTEHFNSVLEITVSFLGIHKWEPDIHIGFSPALHLQCIVSVSLLSLVHLPAQIQSALTTY